MPDFWIFSGQAGRAADRASGREDPTANSRKRGNFTMKIRKDMKEKE